MTVQLRDDRLGGPAGVEGEAPLQLVFQRTQLDQGENQADQHHAPEDDAGDPEWQACPQGTGAGAGLRWTHRNPSSLNDIRTGQTPLRPAPKMANPMNQGKNHSCS